MGEPLQLSDNTLDTINKLLVQNITKGKVRGLYSVRDMNMICEHLEELAAWLSDNQPDFMKENKGEFTKYDRFSEKTSLCISYVDHIRTNTDDKPAQRLQKFYNAHLADLYSHLHILPHFESPIIHENVKGPAARADGGFEAKNFKMDPYFGKPEDLTDVQSDLMFDFVLNHLSVHGDWFKKFLEDEEGYEDFFVTIPEEKIDQLDWAKIFRPREHNPVIPYTNSKGKVKHVWCTFSETQADINLKNPKVFCAIMDALVKDFIAQGASWIRLDAIGYLVKMFGLSADTASTSCFGIDETHNVLKAIRVYLDDICPVATLVPEVNATADVIKTYYGANHDEGHMVYEFPSAPLSLFAIYRRDATAILEWAVKRNQDPESIGLAFTASHDGIGVLPMYDAPDLLDGTPAVNAFLYQVERRGGGINYKSKVVDGQKKRIPYEVCITWLQAIMTPPEHAALMGNRLSNEELNQIVDRFIASQSFIYTAPHCVPADYMGLITGLLNDDDLYYIAGHRRNKNRGLVQLEEFDKALAHPETNYEFLRAKIFNSKKHLIETRRQYPAFSPYAKCEVDVISAPEGKEYVGKPIFSVLRHSPHCNEKILTLTNCKKRSMSCQIKIDGLKSVDNILGNSVEHAIDGDTLKIRLGAYQMGWLKINH